MVIKIELNKKDLRDVEYRFNLLVCKEDHPYVILKNNINKIAQYNIQYD